MHGRVFINSENILKNSRAIKPGDKISIRGKGKFDYVENVGTTKKGKLILKFQKYVG